jgi:hypothetical protein
MTYAEYLKKYNRLVKRLIALGLIYVRKVFWCLTARQIKAYAKVQLRAMRRAVETMRGQ